MLNLARLELLGTPQVSPGKLPQASSGRYTSALPRDRSLQFLQHVAQLFEAIGRVGTAHQRRHGTGGQCPPTPARNWWAVPTLLVGQAVIAHSNSFSTSRSFLSPLVGWAQPTNAGTELVGSAHQRRHGTGGQCPPTPARNWWAVPTLLVGQAVIAHSNSFSTSRSFLSPLVGWAQPTNAGTELVGSAHQRRHGTGGQCPPTPARNWWAVPTLLVGQAVIAHSNSFSTSRSFLSPLVGWAQPTNAGTELVGSAHPTCWAKLSSLTPIPSTRRAVS